jgi:uncharacterized protein YfbU (UPF0304 family)
MEVELIKQNCKSHELRMLNLYLLMYADEMVLFSESMHELQTMNLVQYDNPTLHIHCSIYMLHKYQTMIKMFHGCNNHLVFEW